MGFVVNKFEKVVGDIYVCASWDGEWNSYNNCYILLRDDKVILIDSGKKEHSADLLSALNWLGKMPEDVTHIICTHGHKDHVGGSVLFPSATKIIHSDDLHLLDSELKTSFYILDSDHGKIQGLSYFKVCHHTNGSIVLYEQEHKIIFCGDFICFFGQEIPPEGFVSKGIGLRNWFQQLVLQLSPEEKESLRIDQFFSGLWQLQAVNSNYLCTGHGAIIHGGINSFFRLLLNYKNAHRITRHSRN
jgi:glyoxylase-like metal-dependent hydrolase (beta-lactamase superfamily II)